MAGKDKVSLLADKEVLGSVDTLLNEGLDFLTEDTGLNEHTVADKVDFVLVEDTAGNDMQYMLRAVELKGMTRVGATLETSHYIIVRGEHVNNLTLAFVAPLES
jgi:hypothetical protein